MAAIWLPQSPTQFLFDSPLKYLPSETKRGI
jgi:hypothetical protein